MNADALSATNIVVGITCIVSILLMQNQTGRAMLIFHPATVRQFSQWHRFLTSGLVHADFMHLAINMFVLWSFGNAVERYYYPTFVADFSTQKYLVLYLGGIIVASIPSYVRHNRNPNYAALGASGGVSGVVFAVILLEPWQNLYLYGVIAIPQILAGAAYLFYSWYKDKKADDNIGHLEHFTGAVWGVVFTAIMNPALIPQFFEKLMQGPSWL